VTIARAEREAGATVGPEPGGAPPEPRPSDSGSVLYPSDEAAPPVALYVHVPFCVSICPYCDFVVYAGNATRGPGERMSAFLGALAVELRLRADGLDRRFGHPGGSGRRGLDSVYLGGGTPSLVPAAGLAALLEAIDRRLGIAAGAEITLEANPAADERGDLRAVAAAGVNRVSFGAQSFDDGELRRLGRRHRSRDVADAVAAARAAGIGSVSLDLLYDVPGQSLESWSSSLDAALALEPDHLSIYALTLDDPDAEGLTGPAGDHLPTSAGARRWRERARVEQDDDRAAAQYVLATERLAADGWRGYEISNWARTGHESRHNRAYWERRPYEAIGPGAHAFDGRTRRWNSARLDGYLAALMPADDGAATLPPGGSETIDDAAAAAEAVILGLRMADGIAIALAERLPLVAELSWAQGAGLIETGEDDRVRLTTRGRLLSNELFCRMI